jgi:hypothetical protein
MYFTGELLKSKFEIIVTLIGVTEETGNTIQVFVFAHIQFIKYR